MSDPLRRLHEDERGAAMVEFVLVFPIQLFLTLCVIQFAFLANAHVVVAQAAFMGARAAAVGDLMQGLNPQEAARRIAARTCAVLTTGDAPAVAGTPPPGGTLGWRSASGGIGFDANRQAEAYGHLSVDVSEYPQEGYVACDLSYDYVLTIPVANELFAKLGPRTGEFNSASIERKQACYRIRRVGFIATPWTRPPQASGGMAGSVNHP